MKSARPGPSSATEPGILPLQRDRSGSPRGLLEELLAAARDEHLAGGAPAVHLSLDAPSSADLPGDVRELRVVLAGLLRAAFAAAVRPAPPSDGPTLREVAVTGVDTGDALEIEIADSGAGTGLDALDAEALAAARTHADRCGGRVFVADCPEGGRAVTLRLPHRRRCSRAA